MNTICSNFKQDLREIGVKANQRCPCEIADADGKIRICNHPFGNHRDDLIIPAQQQTVGFELLKTRLDGYFDLVCFFLIMEFKIWGREEFANHVFWTHWVCKPFIQRGRIGYEDLRRCRSNEWFFLLLAAIVICAFNYVHFRPESFYASVNRSLHGK